MVSTLGEQHPSFNEKWCIIQPKDPPMENRLSVELIEKGTYFTVLTAGRSSSNRSDAPTVIARQTRRNGKPAVIFKVSDYYDAIADECR